MRSLKRAKKTKVKQENTDITPEVLEKDVPVEDKKNVTKESKPTSEKKSTSKRVLENPFEELAKSQEALNPTIEKVPVVAIVTLEQGRSDVFEGYRFKKRGNFKEVHGTAVIKRFQCDPNYSVRVIRWANKEE